MSIRFSCPSCAKALKVADDAVGKKGKCPKCGASVFIPPPVRQVHVEEDTSQEQHDAADYESKDDQHLSIRKSRARLIAAGIVVAIVSITCAALVFRPRGALIVTDQGVGFIGGIAAPSIKHGAERPVPPSDEKLRTHSFWKRPLTKGRLWGILDRIREKGRPHCDLVIDDDGRMADDDGYDYWGALYEKRIGKRTIQVPWQSGIGDDGARMTLLEKMDSMVDRENYRRRHATQNTGTAGFPGMP